MTSLSGAPPGRGGAPPASRPPGGGSSRIAARSRAWQGPRLPRAFTGVLARGWRAVTRAGQLEARSKIPRVARPRKLVQEGAHRLSYETGLTQLLLALQRHRGVPREGVSSAQCGNEAQAGTVLTKTVTPDLHSSLSCATGNDASRSSSFHTGPQSAATLCPELLHSHSFLVLLLVPLAAARLDHHAWLGPARWSGTSSFLKMVMATVAPAAKPGAGSRGHICPSPMSPSHQ